MTLQTHSNLSSLHCDVTPLLQVHCGKKQRRVFCCNMRRGVARAQSVNELISAASKWQFGVYHRFEHYQTNIEEIYTIAFNSIRF